ncbi:hypothetical protein [Draconibacterium sp.]|uniref:hypothetical protein n=1 Tax=Draconibacterium sp. TaxID=1965318 RepID=UPI003567DA39
MPKTADDIIKRALTLIDEQVTEFETAASTEMSMEEMALDILPEVCRDLVKELPYELKRYLAKSGTLAEDTIPGGENQSSYVKKKAVFQAPDDFWELVSIRLTVWSRPVTDYIHIDSPEYRVQNNPFTRGGKQNPVVALSNVSTGSKARIECFSVHNDDAKTVDQFQYVAFDNVPDNSGKTWPDEVFDEVTKALAAQLHQIKSRLDEASLRNDETLEAIKQHE